MSGYDSRRYKVVDFIGPYYYAGLNAMINKELENEVSSTYDLMGRKVCVVSGTTCEHFAEKIPDIELMRYNNKEATLNAL